MSYSINVADRSGQPRSDVDVELTLDGEGSLSPDKALMMMVAKTTPSGGVLVRWHRWPTGQQGGLDATLRAKVVRQDLVLDIVAIAEALRSEADG